MIIVLLVVILILCIFNAASLFVLGSALMKNTEILNNMASVYTAIPPKPKKFTDLAGFRMDEDENLIDVEKTSFPQN